MGVLILCSFVSRDPEDGDVSPKHVAEFACMDGGRVNVSCVHLLVYVDDCN